MKHFVRSKSLVMTLVACSAIVLAAGCSSLGLGTKTQEPVQKPQVAANFDTVIQAYSNGQFLLDGAALTAPDLGSHFAYLHDVGKLPKTILLTPSNESDIDDDHLAAMANLSSQYGFEVYYLNDGKLMRVVPKKAQ